MTAPTEDRSLSSKTTLQLLWTKLVDGLGDGGKITGYELEMDDGAGGQFTRKFYGVGTPLITHYLATQLSTGLTYQTRVKGYNINGPGDWSTPSSF